VDVIDRRNPAAWLRVATLALMMASGSATMAQQQYRLRNLPEAPAPKSQDPTDSTQKPATPLETTIEVLGKRSIFFPDLAHDRGPLDSRQKLELAVDETVAPSTFLASAFTAGIGQARDSFSSYGQGWAGYGKRMGSSIASKASGQLFGTFLLPSLLHQDPRYFVKLWGTPGNRILYALERVVVTRTDDGRETANISELLGGLMAEGLANSYLPDNERTAGKTFTRFGVRIGFSALDNVVKEYWPTIFKSLRMNKIVPSNPGDPGTVRPQVGPPAPKPEKG
jgi:hypothetical protein